MAATVPMQRQAEAKRLRRLAKARYNAVAPRFWHGLSMVPWFKLLAENRFRVSPTRIPTALAVTAFSVLNSTLGTIQSAIYGRKIRRQELAEPPVFILGHWRSGTTLLHELMVRDEAHNFPNTCQCFAPSHFFLTQRLISSFFGFVMPEQRPMDNMPAGWNHPQEDEFALCTLGAPSPYRFMAFCDPEHTYDDDLTLNDLPPADLARWKHALKTFMQALSLHDSRRLVMKSPTHTARLGLLHEMFPDAKFIHVARDPVKIFASTMRLWTSLCHLQALRVPRDDEWLREYVLRTGERMYSQYQADREFIPRDQLCELRYEELVQDPERQLARIYDQLDLGDFSRVQPHVAAYQQETRGYQPNRHQISDEDRELVHERWGHLFSRFGYDTSTAPVGQATA